MKNFLMPKLIMCRRKKLNHGYTMVEIMIAAVVVILGFAALLNLQVSSLRGVSDARATTIAINLAEHFAEFVRAEVLQCPNPAPPGSCEFEATTGDFTGTWTIWGDGVDNRIAPNGVAPDTADSGITQEFPENIDRQYCVHYKLAWVVPGIQIRLDVRVLWPRDATDPELFEACALELVPSPTSAAGTPLTTGMVTTTRSINLRAF
ncbi:MAG: hypothetical protein HUU55_15065 [Myxococcales bacterium]|nr:hypothetical protein [Myxococcales bacterium]